MKMSLAFPTDKKKSTPILRITLRRELYFEFNMRKSHLSAMPQVVRNPMEIGEPLCVAYAL